MIEGWFAFVVLLTFSQVNIVEVHCPNPLCVALIYAQVQKSPTVERFQLWKAGDYKRSPVGNTFTWPPIFDEQYQ